MGNQRGRVHRCPTASMSASALRRLGVRPPGAAGSAQETAPNRFATGHTAMGTCLGRKTLICLEALLFSGRGEV